MNSRRDEPTGMGDASRPSRDSSDYLRHTAEHEIACEQFVERVTDYVEEAVPAQTRTQVEEHLVMCDWCITYAEQIRATILALNELGSEEAVGGPATGHTLADEPAPVVLAALRQRREGSP